MSAVGSSLLEVFDYVWDRFTTRVDGLTDDEYFWEPVANCWTLRRDPAGVWVLDGSEYRPDELLDPPMTTIAWRLGHSIGVAVGGFADRRFPEGASGVPVTFPGSASEVPAFLDANYGRWRAGMVALDDAGWGAPLGAAWGPYATSNSVDLALHVLDELVHHAAEIGLLRDLYAAARTRRA